MEPGPIPGGQGLISEVAEAVWHPSPNFGDRRGCSAPDCVLLHYTAMQTAEAALARLCDPDYEVSAHYLIAEDGRVWQMVREADRAWHAGRGAWGACEDLNSHSIGIELANPATHPFPEPQMAALEHLLRGVVARWGIAAERVLGHSDSAVARKIDPGPKFDWQRLAMQGFGVWPQCVAPGDFDLDALRFGYRGEAADVLAAFRLRFRPWAHGPLDDMDRGLMADLAQRWPHMRHSSL
ncbi:N-acetylmuramoyl-L-alanine amidase [Sagittula marina]|uniref:N-acetylmuramoyl-L-alanine amidase n=1 Tax=Sagittula marina TaxID=943940 RepID=A0A7W6DTB5_9RHOB|nr:N-acetylmuramoyl-L-alanine amidase [Sagittula marina]MBB3985678.1 N-acetylmuramoyl-L-alanine amidase [Sagittula marina]